MSEKSKNKREWVKTAAIIFLSVMLVLTFFSQTIMNYSLPIVTAQYINSGQISAKVRGSGKIESADLYNVQIPETRDIQSIEVKKGDKVEKDQVMIHLKDKESDELKTAKEELEKLQVEYKKALLDGGISDFVYYDAVAGREDSTDGYRAKIKAAKARVENLDAQILALKNQQLTGSYDAASLDAKIASAQTAMDAAQAKMEGANVTAPSTTYANANDAKAAMDNAATAMEAIRTDRDMAQTAMNSYYTEHHEQVEKLQAAYNERARLETEDAVNGTTDANNAFATWLTSNPTDGVSGSNTASNIKDMIAAINGTPSDGTSPASGYYLLTEEYNKKQTAYEEAYKTYSDAAAAYNSFGAASSSQGAYNSAKSEYDNAKSNYDNLVQMKANATLSGKDLENKIAQLENEKTKATSDLDQLLKDIPGEIELNSTARILKEKQEELQKLLDNAIGATIDAPIAGTIVDVNVVSGGKAEANATVVTIQPENKGFTLSVPVTAEQAKKVSVGSIAEVQNSWYYNDITVELKKIQNDPANPGKSKLLVFDVSGDVSAGQELSISVGSKSQGYDMIVPNSAIRSDNNGKFILIVESKSSPIGNRYYASRVDIEVLAEDDTSTAISAPIESWEYVITAANKPVEAGKQVRLQD
ncbi:MAG: HlyD family efflux transporter periplasmic adaptor subunit [Lachnospiraceae bacterium]|jgi:biotin carboxyl carrier protein|nr:HlyD family efflux transporter periplasmic adaptor subunit [Lachnospiraceae bacterium]